MTPIKLYRYVSFESFIDIMQSKKLTLIHPTLFEDPKELWAYKKYSKLLPFSIDNFKILQTKEKISKLQMCNTYLQCWTKSHIESDAFWRIYSHNKHSLRISIDLDDVQLLDNIICGEVNYLDDLNDISEKFDHIEHPENLYLVKRNAFNHENEVRLIKTLEITEDKYEEYINELGYYESQYPEEIEDEEGNPIQILPQDCYEIAKELNLEIEKKVFKVDFSHIPNFIKGVMVNPFAEEWYVDTVKNFL